MPLIPTSTAVATALQAALSRPLYYPVVQAGSEIKVLLTRPVAPAMVTCNETVAVVDRDHRFGGSVRLKSKKQFTCDVGFMHAVSADVMEQSLAAWPIIVSPFQDQGAIFVMMDRVTYKHRPQIDPNPGDAFTFEFVATAVSSWSGLVPEVIYTPGSWLPVTSKRQLVHNAIVNALASMGSSQITVQETDCQWTDSRNRRSVQQERQSWNWTAVASFTRQVALDEIERALNNSPIILSPDPSVSFPALFVEVSSVGFSHPPLQSPNRGSVVAFNFIATHR